MLNSLSEKGETPNNLTTSLSSLLPTLNSTSSLINSLNSTNLLDANSNQDLRSRISLSARNSLISNYKLNLPLPLATGSVNPGFRNLGSNLNGLNLANAGSNTNIFGNALNSSLTGTNSLGSTNLPNLNGLPLTTGNPPHLQLPGLTNPALSTRTGTNYAPTNLNINNLVDSTQFVVIDDTLTFPDSYRKRASDLVQKQGYVRCRAKYCITSGSGKAFSVDELLLHIKQMHRGQIFCKKCHKVLLGIRLNEHAKVCTLVCPVCNKEFQETRYVQRHMKRVHGAKLTGGSIYMNTNPDLTGGTSQQIKVSADNVREIKRKGLSLTPIKSYRSKNSFLGNTTSHSSFGTPTPNPLINTANSILNQANLINNTNNPLYHSNTTNSTSTLSTGSPNLNKINPFLPSVGNAMTVNQQTNPHPNPVSSLSLNNITIDSKNTTNALTSSSLNTTATVNNLNNSSNLLKANSTTSLMNNLLPSIITSQNSLGSHNNTNTTNTPINTGGLRPDLFAAIQNIQNQNSNNNINTNINNTTTINATQSLSGLHTSNNLTSMANTSNLVSSNTTAGLASSLSLPITTTGSTNNLNLPITSTGAGAISNLQNLTDENSNLNIDLSSDNEITVDNVNKSKLPVLGGGDNSTTTPVSSLPTLPGSNSITPVPTVSKANSNNLNITQMANQINSSISHIINPLQSTINNLTKNHKLPNLPHTNTPTLVNKAPSTTNINLTNLNSTNTTPQNTQNMTLNNQTNTATITATPLPSMINTNLLTGNKPVRPNLKFSTKNPSVSLSQHTGNANNAHLNSINANNLLNNNRGNLNNQSSFTPKNSNSAISLINSSPSISSIKVGNQK